MGRGKLFFLRHDKILHEEKKKIITVWDIKAADQIDQMGVKIFSWRGYKASKNNLKQSTHPKILYIYIERVILLPLMM